VLSDTYWPQFVAETGWVGFASMAAFVVILLIYTALRYFRAPEGVTKMYCSAAFLGISLAIFVSLASPVLEDPGLMLVPAVMFGVAERLYRSRHDARNHA
jgi:uncharacterized protein YqgC (DUF456 family)